MIDPFFFGQVRISLLYYKPLISGNGINGTSTHVAPKPLNEGKGSQKHCFLSQRDNSVSFHSDSFDFNNKIRSIKSQFVELID